MDKKDKKAKRSGWAFIVLLVALILSFAFSLTSQIVLGSTNIATAYAIVVALMLISIIFEIVATAAVTCDVEPFLAMSARKIKGAKMAVRLSKNSVKVSAICSDVIGDVCGIISGACAAVIIAKQFLDYTGFAEIIIAAGFAAALATLTLAGKVAGKVYATKNANKIVFNVARLLSVFKRK